MTPNERDKLILETIIKIGAKQPLISKKQGKFVSEPPEEQRKEISLSFEAEEQTQAAEYFKQGI